MKREEIAQVESVESFSSGFPCRDEMQIIVDRSATHTAYFGFLEGREEPRLVEQDAGKLWRDLLAEHLGGVRTGDAESEASAGESAEGFRESVGDYGMATGKQHLAAGMVVGIARAEGGHDD